MSPAVDVFVNRLSVDVGPPSPSGLLPVVVVVARRWKITGGSWNKGRRKGTEVSTAKDRAVKGRIVGVLDRRKRKREGREEDRSGSDWGKDEERYSERRSFEQVASRWINIARSREYPRQDDVPRTTITGRFRWVLHFKLSRSFRIGIIQG